MTASGDRGDNTARCPDCDPTRHCDRLCRMTDAPVPAADRQTDEERPGPDTGPGTLAARLADWREERYTAARAASERDLRSTLNLSAIAEIGAHGPGGITHPTVADAVMADLGAAITEFGELREAVAEGLRDVLAGCEEWPTGLELTDAVLALPAVRALLDAAAKVQRVEAWVRSMESMASDYEEAANSVTTLALVDEALEHAADIRASAEGVRAALGGGR